MVYRIIATLMMSCTMAQADQIKVVTDIAPIGSLAAQLSDAQVTVLIEPGISPHDASLKPSMALALQEADVVFWLGEGMTPGLLRPISELARNAKVLELLDLEDVDYLETREGAELSHDDHDDHDHDHHDHGEFDPHAWLSPKVAQSWTYAMAEVLGAVDQDAKAEIDGRAEALREKLAGITLDMPAAALALHDAFQYLEEFSGLEVVGAVSSADGSAPSAARMSAVIDVVEEHNVQCLLSELSETGAAATRTAQSLDLNLVPLDILGVDIERGEALPDLYMAMMSRIVDQLQACQ